MKPIALVLAVLFPAVCSAELQFSPKKADWQVLSGEWNFNGGEIIGHARGNEIAWLILKSSRLLPHSPRDLYINFEFKTPTPANGGLQIRAHWLPKIPVPQGVAPARLPKTMYGYRVNIDTAQKNGTGAILVAHGKPPLAVPSIEAQDAVITNGWNSVKVVAKGTEIQVSVNGVLAAKTTDERFIHGAIALQVVPNPGQPVTDVYYRNLSVGLVGQGAQWRSLFDGKTLAGWKKWGTENWAVEDGAIHGSSGPKKSEGYLATKETWKDFWVHGAFKMLGKGNYGLFYHSTIKYNDKQFPVISGLQGEVAPPYPGPTGWVYESYKRGWLVKPDPTSMQAYALRPGHWNEMDIRSIGNHITTWVNGIRIVDLVDTGQQISQGSFALQLHTGGDTGILWKDLRVKKTLQPGP